MVAALENDVPNARRRNEVGRLLAIRGIDRSQGALDACAVPGRLRQCRRCRSGNRGRCRVEDNLKREIRMNRFVLAGKLLLVGLTSSALVACSGSSDSGGGSGTPDDGPADAVSIDEGESQTPSRAATTAPYQTGFVLSSIGGEVVTTGFVSPSIDFDTDEQANEISDNIFANVYPDFAYDDEGRATTIDYQFGAPVTLEYNEDGTLARVERERSDARVTFAEYEYEDGNLAVRRNGRIEDGETTAAGRVEYEYSSDNRLVGAKEFFRDGADPFVSYQYVTDAVGRIAEIAETDPSGNQGDRWVLTHDEFSNITRVERFDEEGNLRVITTYAYAPSSEPVVNVISLFSALSGSYIPDADSTTFF